MKPHEEWLAVAARDLESAKLLGSSSQNLLDIAIYHTQQSAEKAFKAYLSWKGQEIDRTHFLPGLVNSCISFDSEFKKLMDDSVDLNPYSTRLHASTALIQAAPESSMVFSGTQ